MPDVDAIIKRLENDAVPTMDEYTGDEGGLHVTLAAAVAAVREAAGQPDWREVVAWLRSDPVEVVRVRLADLIEGRFGEAVGERKERAVPEVERLSVWNTTGPKRPFLAVRAEAYDALEADRDHLRADIAAAEREAEFLRGELAKAVAAVREAASPSASPIGSAPLRPEG